MKHIRTLLSFVVFIVLILTIAGCGSYLRLEEETIYQQKIDAFFNALDKGDSDEIKSLFSRTVLSSDSDLDEQIDKLISIYPRSTTAIMFDGLLGGEYADDAGMYKSMAYATFPVVSNNRYFWVYIELIYEDDFSSDNIGLNRVFFYTADEYFMFIRDENTTYPSDIGLGIYAEQELEAEVRCINALPYEFTPIERNLNLSEIEAYLKSNTNWADFTSTFGHPNAQGTLGRYYYEISDSNHGSVYLEIGVPNGEIAYVNLVDDLNWIECIVEESEE